MRFVFELLGLVAITAVPECRSPTIDWNHRERPLCRMTNASRIQTMPWHRRLFFLSFVVFDGQPGDTTPTLSYWVTVVGMAMYLVAAFFILLTLNLVTLPLGVFAEPIWWRRARFRLLRLPNGLPLIPFCVAIVLAYSSYQTWLLRGPGIALGGWALVAGVALLSLIVIGLWNGLSRRLGKITQPDATAR